MTPENKIEKTFIDILTLRENQWTYRGDLKTESALWENLRGHINRINLARLDGIPLTDREFEQLKVEFKRLTSTPFNSSQGESDGENPAKRITAGLCPVNTPLRIWEEAQI